MKVLFVQDVVQGSTYKIICVIKLINTVLGLILILLFVSYVSMGWCLKELNAIDLY